MVMLDRSPIDLILARLENQVPASVLPFFRYGLEHARNPFRVERVARAHGLHARAVEYRFRRARLAPPATAFAWCRLLLAVNHSSTPPEPRKRSPSSLGYGTSGALRKSIAKYLGLSGRTLRSPGSFELAPSSDSWWPFDRPRRRRQ